MTDPSVLARIDSVIDNAHCVAADSLTLRRATVKSLLADSRALRELVEALPKCGRGFHCQVVATYIDERCCPVWGCDAHHREGDRELETASIIRKLTP